MHVISSIQSFQLFTVDNLFFCPKKRKNGKHLVYQIQKDKQNSYRHFFAVKICVKYCFLEYKTVNFDFNLDKMIPTLFLEYIFH